MAKREKFSHDRTFVVFKPFRLDGKDYTRGEPFNKTATSNRRLRQLFEQYFIDYPQGSVSEPKAQNHPGTNNRVNHNGGGPPRSATFLEEDIVQYAESQRVHTQQEQVNGKESQETSQGGQSSQDGKKEQEKVERKSEVGPKQVPRTTISRVSL